MKAKDKNKEAEFSELLRYTEGKMTDEERNAFEKKLQKDPFADEAAEGFASISTSGVSDDLKMLEKRLKVRLSRRNKFIYYRIAASIAVIMILSSIYLIVRRTRPSDQIGELSIKPVTLEIQKQEALREPKATISSDDMASGAKKDVQRPIGQKEEIIANEAAPDIVENPDNEKKADDVKEPDQKGAEQNFAMEKIAAPAAVDAPVSVSYGARNNAGAASAKAFNRAESITTKSTPPQPVIGQAGFERYLEENMRKPDTLTSGQNIEVIVSFIVRKSGRLDSIKVLSTPGLKYSDEAIRLIKEGPAWKPALENGLFFDENVQVSIVFK
jgi:hypothetical protein